MMADASITCLTPWVTSNLSDFTSSDPTTLLHLPLVELVPPFHVMRLDILPFLKDLSSSYLPPKCGLCILQPSTLTSHLLKTISSPLLVHLLQPLSRHLILLGYSLNPVNIRMCIHNKLTNAQYA